MRLGSTGATVNPTAGHVTAERLQKSEVIGFRDTESLHHSLALGLFGQEAGEDGPHLWPIEGLGALGERLGDWRTGAIVEPGWVIDKTEIAMLIEAKSADQAPVPQDG
jgi:hypothetical protein